MQFDYYFNNLGHMDADPVDGSQRTIQNTRFSTYNISNYYIDNTSDSHVKFAIKQPTLTFTGMATGHGLNGAIVDTESVLIIKTVEERPLDKIQLNQRNYASIPYLGRGSCDPTLEHKMLQGQSMAEMKSTSTIMEKSFMGYTMFPSETMPSMPSMPDWQTIGQSTRNTNDDQTMSNGYRPMNRGL